MSSSRRQFLKWSALGCGTGVLPMSLLAHDMKTMSHKTSGGLCKHVLPDQSHVPALLSPTTLTPYVDALPIPPVLQARHGETLRVAMTENEQKLHRDLPPARVWTYGGCMPGPTIEARSGTPLTVQWRNDLPSKHFLPIDHRIMGAERSNPEVRAIVHVHGAKVQTSSDGYPDDWYVPGKSRTHTYPFEQDASTLWYHDHAMGINRLNIYAGMYGMLLLRDEHEMSLGLPNGEQEIPLTLVDRLITKDGQMYYPVSGNNDGPWVPEVFGDATLVNGKLMPYLEVQPRKYRFRLLNAANARFFHIGLAGHRPFQQIGSDQGLLASPVTQQGLLIAPGERADLIVDFSALAGQSIELMNGAQPIMQYRVGKGAMSDKSVIPAVLRDVPRTPVASASKRRLLTLDEYDDCVQAPMLMLLDGKRWHEPVTEKPTLNSTEMWEFLNVTDDTHPIHLHLVRFQIVERQPYDLDAWMADKTVRFTAPPQPPPAHEMGWKDIAQAWPGMVTRIIVRFEGYAGRYVWHCHLLEHESNEMMRPFEVVPA